MKYLLILNLLFLFSCGVSKEEAQKGKTITEAQRKADLVVEFGENGLISFNPIIVKMVEKEGEDSSQFMTILNTSQELVNLTINKDGLLSGFIQLIPVNCGISTTLKYRQNCMFEIKLVNTSVFMSNEKELHGSIINSASINESISINNQPLSIEATVYNNKTAAEIYESEQLYLTKKAINAQISKNKIFREVILIKNMYRYDIENFNPYLSQESSQGGSFLFNHNCPLILSRKSHCLLTVEYNPASASLGNAAEVEIRLFDGVQIPVRIEISEDPALLSQIRVQDIQDIGSKTNHYYFYNDSRLYSFMPEYNIGENLNLEFPEAVSIFDNCNVALDPSKSCLVRLVWDSKLYPNGLTFNKELELNGSTYTFSFTGTSPCSTGNKYNNSTKTCSPNLGVFDSADSLFGHAVFQ